MQVLSIFDHQIPLLSMFSEHSTKLQLFSGTQRLHCIHWKELGSRDKPMANGYWIIILQFKGRLETLFIFPLRMFIFLK